MATCTLSSSCNTYAGIACSGRITVRRGVNEYSTWVRVPLCHSARATEAIAKCYTYTKNERVPSIMPGRVTPMFSTASAGGRYIQSQSHRCLVFPTSIRDTDMPVNPHGAIARRTIARRRARRRLRPRRSLRERAPRCRALSRELSDQRCQLPIRHMSSRPQDCLPALVARA